ncbi:chemotaxis protein CheB [Actinophytocola xanthii]|uniref:protein-glutamate methylesterase n=1 Tax=Actinophytocola xanthii TaxID=1912961 RepID=A0A1Q8CSB1_9PSEU|nr:chemotaxis protein CheB [Actinophytocola xanthii]OLF17244.1 chemotaxis protein CheB [Actinophytocola xanthii]
MSSRSDNHSNSAALAAGGRGRDVIVVGASAGGVEALQGFVAGLPHELAASVLVVLHLPPGGSSALPAILQRAGELPVAAARHGEALVHGRVYVAPPNHHLLLLDGTVALSHGPTENGRRPAINALFRSAAIAAGPATTGVLLSGVLDDGVAGLLSIVSRGGTVVVQDPEEALFPTMPRHALASLRVDHVLPVRAIGSLLDKLSREEVEIGSAPAPSRLMRLENDIATTDSPAHARHDPAQLGPVSGFTCPDCDGALVEMSPATRYRCRVGHAWTAEALLNALGGSWERALSIAIRTLDEKAALSKRMADQARERGSTELAGRYNHNAAEAMDAAALLRGPLEVAARQGGETR